MATSIIVISDTHLHKWSEVHPEIRKAVSEADIAVHCGDFVREDVLRGFRAEAKQSVVVHGNTDPPEMRRNIPYVEILNVEQVKIGVTHPAWGGPEFPPEDLISDFEENVDVIVFGHLHETLNEVIGDILYVNPGQAYSSFMVAATIAKIYVDSDQVFAEIVTIVPAH